MIRPFIRPPRMHDGEPPMSKAERKQYLRGLSTGTRGQILKWLVRCDPRLAHGVSSPLGSLGRAIKRPCLLFGLDRGRSFGHT